mgnify:CR=1 FL=1
MFHVKHDFKKLKKFAKEKDIILTDGMLEQMDDLCSLLLEKNKVMNLTAIEDMEQIEIKHLIDSLESVPLIKELAGEEFSLADVGCGAGFPGIPLKIVFPKAHFTLVDSINKRITFVEEAGSRLGLEKFEAVAARAEDIARTEKRESFDICVSRAVAKTNVLLEYCLPMVKTGGYCIFYKSSEPEKEIGDAQEALKVLGGRIRNTLSFELPEGGGGRSLIVVEKLSPTGEKYPRKAGRPAKRPIENIV